MASGVSDTFRNSFSASLAVRSVISLRSSVSTTPGLITVTRKYQKRLRLLEARRLMLSEIADVTRACHRVGYESPSQFSRE